MNNNISCETQRTKDGIKVYRVSSPYDGVGLFPQGTEIIKLEFHSEILKKARYIRINSDNLETSMGVEDDPLWLERIEKCINKGVEPLLVEVKQITNKGAYCNIRYNGSWIPISLNVESLTKNNIQENDSFSWFPQEDGVLRENDVLNHPRKPHRHTVGNAEYISNIFSKLEDTCSN